MPFNGKLLRIELKVTCGVIRRDNSKEKLVNLPTEVPQGLLGDIFNCIRNLINTNNAETNTYVASINIQICSSKRMEVKLLQQFEDMLINFERGVKITNIKQ